MPKKDLPIWMVALVAVGLVCSLTLICGCGFPWEGPTQHQIVVIGAPTPSPSPTATPTPCFATGAPCTTNTSCCSVACIAGACR